MYIHSFLTHINAYRAFDSSILLPERGGNEDALEKKKKNVKEKKNDQARKKKSLLVFSLRHFLFFSLNIPSFLFTLTHAPSSSLFPHPAVALLLVLLKRSAGSPLHSNLSTSFFFA